MIKDRINSRIKRQSEIKELIKKLKFEYNRLESEIKNLHNKNGNKYYVQNFIE